MVDVKESQLFVLFAKDKEQRVQELDKLRDVVPPDCFDDLQNEDL